MRTKHDIFLYACTATVSDSGWGLPPSSSLHGVVLPKTALVQRQFVRARLYVFLGILFLSRAVVAEPVCEFSTATATGSGVVRL